MLKRRASLASSSALLSNVQTVQPLALDCTSSGHGLSGIARTSYGVQRGHATPENVDFFNF